MTLLNARAPAITLPVVDTQPLVKGSADPTKLLRFALGGFTAGATRVMTPPNADATLAGLQVAQTFTVAQAVTGLNIIPNPNYFGAGLLSGLVLGYPGGDAIENGVLVSVARKSAANVPFVSFAGTDDGATRTIYYGGGGWGATDATQHQFYTAPTYSETLNAGVLRMLINSIGVNIKNSSLADVFSTSFSTGETHITLPRFDNGNVTDIIVEYENTTSGYGALNFRVPGDNRWSFGATSPTYSGDGEGFWIFNSAGASEYALFITPGSRVGIGNLVNSTVLARLHVQDRDAATNAITNVQILSHNSSGTPAAGFGTGLLFKGHSSTTTGQDQGRLYWLWPDANGATHATRRAAGVLTAFSVTTERECLSWEATSTEAKLSFLGATRIGRPASYTLAATATRTMPTPESAFTGQDNAQGGSVYAKFADLATLQTRLDSVEGVLRQLIIDLASTSGYGLLAAS